MKKILAIITMLLMVMSTAFAIDLLEDEEMGNVEGQAGLSIQQYLSAMTITTSYEGLSWGDDDGCSTPGLGGTGVGGGHLAIRAASASGLVQATMGMVMAIPTTAPIKMDVDATGIYLALPGLNITVSTPPRLQFSVAGGTVDAFPGIISGTTNQVLGDLATDNLLVTVATPSIMRLAPH